MVATLRDSSPALDSQQLQPMCSAVGTADLTGNGDHNASRSEVMRLRVSIGGSFAVVSFGDCPFTSNLKGIFAGAWPKLCCSLL